MKVQKFPQSHLVISKKGKTLIIDPGYITFEKGFKVEDFQGADAYLISHQHADHLGPETIKEVVGDKPVFGNYDVVEKLIEAGVLQAKEIKDKEEIEAAGFIVKAVNLPHFEKPGFEMPPNTGFLIDEVFFHPGDGNIAPGHLHAENAAVPIGGWTVTLDSALKFSKDIGAKVVVPIHYDWYEADPERFKEMAKAEGVEVRILDHGEETEI